MTRTENYISWNHPAIATLSGGELPSIHKSVADLAYDVMRGSKHTMKRKSV